MTAITFGSEAGNNGGDFGPALPTAAISTIAAFVARPQHQRADRVLRTGKAHIDDARAIAGTAQSSPLRMQKVVPSALPDTGSKARTARIGHFGATPGQLRSRDDHARDAGAMCMRRTVGAERG